MPGFHPALYFSGRRIADLLDHRARGGARRAETRAPRIVRRQLCADLARMAQPLPARLAEDRAARLQRALPPHVGILSGLLRSRLPLWLDRCGVLQAGGVTPAARAGKWGGRSRPMVCRCRFSYWLLNRFCGMPAAEKT